MKILIFGGTTEGRELAECLSNNKIPCEVCVATRYGGDLLHESDYIRVRQGRLTTAQMLSLLQNGSFSAVIDATHPYAVEVSKNIQAAVQQYDDDAVHPGDVNKCLPLLRFDRQGATKASSPVCTFFATAGAASLALKSTSGKILLTTGSKNLSEFCADPELRSRLVVRTLPSLESLELCYKNGLEGHQIIAMQGPFSKEMNSAFIREYGISVLVTKESGAVGGYAEKIEACEECGIKCFVIEKPAAEAAFTVTSYSALFTRLEEILHTKISFTPKIHLTLIGAGPGNPDFMTLQAQKAVSDADYVFGAERVLETVKNLITTTKIHSQYLAKDIIPVLEEARNAACGGELKATVLFSGDTGFYSGAEAFFNAAEKLPDTEIEIIPGISCVQYLCAKFHKNWQDYEFLSLHGIKKENWINKLSEIVHKNRQIFFITSSFSDIQALGTEILRLKSSDSVHPDAKIYLGFNLSYPDEKLFTISPEECSKISTPGLYCGIIEL